MDAENTAALPHDTEAEKITIGALLTPEGQVATTAKERLFATLREADFYEPPHQTIFHACVAVGQAGQPVELPSVSTYLRDHNQIDGVGGGDYLTALVALDWGLSAQGYAERVRDRGLVRRALALQENLGKLQDKPDKLAAAVEQGLVELHDIAARREVTVRPQRRTSWTGTDLAATDFPEPQWIVPGMIPEGLTFIGGRPKAGKSIFVLQLAFATATGGRCLDHDCEQGRVLILSLEDGERRIKDRTGPEKQAWTATALENVTFETAWPVAGAGGFDALRHALIETDYALCIIDTFTRFAGGTLDQDKVGEVSDLLTALQAIGLDTNTAIIVIDHFNKLQPDDPVDAMLGSTAKAAIPDTIVGLYRRTGSSPLLRGRGRDVEEFEVAVTFDAPLFCWQPTADEHGVVTGSVQNTIMDLIVDLIVDSGGKACLTEIAAELDADPSHIRRELINLVNKGVLVKLPKEGRRQPYGLPGDTLL